MKKSVCIVGVGPHAKRIYFKYFVDYKLNPALVVELVSKEQETREFLKSKGIENYEMMLLEDGFKDDVLLNEDFAKKLQEKCKELKITHAIISTEPKAHNAYVNFFLDNKIPVLSDKPITVRKDMLKKSAIKSIKQDYDTIVKKSVESNTMVQIMCQRLYHQGYNYIKDLVKKTIKQYNVPVTFCEVYHCDGKWMMPHDLECENHPYKYGYGKLYHSGYHFIQLLSEIVSLNKYLKDDSKKLDHVELSSTFISPEDELAEITLNDYKDIFKKQNIPTYYNSPKQNYDKYGEKNNYSLMTFKNKSGRTITVAELNLLQNGFSRRGWIQTKEDHYKGNGRIRHEYVNIQIGTLMNIQVHSYQSKEIKDRTDLETQTGGLEHFDIHIYRNSDLIGGKPYEMISLKDLYNVKEKNFIGHNEKSREKFLNDFLAGKTEQGNIKTHSLGIELLYNLSKLYLGYSKHHKQSSVSFNIADKV